MGRPRSLTEEEEAEVITRYRAGSSTWRLAEQFGVGRATIGRVLDRYEVTYRRVRGGARGAREPEDGIPSGVSPHQVVDHP